MHYTPTKNRIWIRMTARAMLAIERLTNFWLSQHTHSLILSFSRVSFSLSVTRSLIQHTQYYYYRSIGSLSLSMLIVRRVFVCMWRWVRYCCCVYSKRLRVRERVPENGWKRYTDDETFAQSKTCVESVMIVTHLWL